MSAAAVRIRAKFTPSWEGSIEGWVVNFINKQLWRVRPHFEFDDLYQDAYMFFLVCTERYPEVVDPPHFMSLFQRCFSNRINDLASRRTKDRVFAYYDENSEIGPPTSGDILMRQQKTCPEMMQADLDLLLDDAPPAVRALAETCLSAPDELLAFLRDEATGLRETIGERLGRLLGVPATHHEALRVATEAWASGTA